MITSKAEVRIGPLEHEILRAMDRARGRVWTLNNLSVPASMTADQARHAVSRLVDAGLVDRLERGSYVVHPRSGRVPVLPIDLVAAWLANESYAIVGRAAAEHHRLTLDTPSTVEIQIPRPKRPVDFRGVHFAFTQGSRQSVAADNIETPTRAVVASPAKVIALLLTQESARRGARPQRDTALVLEMLESGRRRGMWSHTDWAGFVQRHGNAQTARRLGFLLDMLHLPGAEDLAPLRGRSGNKPFSPLYPAEGPVDTRWRLVLNDPALEGTRL